VSGGRGPRRIRRVLVVCEVALAVLLLAGARLLGRSFANVLGVDPGFPVDRLAVLRVALPGAPSHRSDEGRARATPLLAQGPARLARLPGAVAAGAIHMTPLAAYGNDNTFAVEGREVPSGAQPPDEEVRVVTPGLFEALRAPLLRGRTFTAG